MKTANNNRRKGHNAERYYCKIFRRIGFSKCVTSRYGSRLHDDAGIDLINIPFHVQIKAGKQRGLNFREELKRCKSLINKKISERKPLLLIHKKEGKRGKRKEEFDDIVIMSTKEFFNLIQKIKWD